MMTAGFWIVGAVFCLLGTLVLAVLAFAAFRYLVGERPGPQPANDTGIPNRHRSPAEHLGR